MFLQHCCLLCLQQVTLTLDDCKEALIPDDDTSLIGNSRSTCQDSQFTPGENRFLNVASMLELGGRNSMDKSWWPAEVDSKARTGFDGCVKSLQHNGEVSVLTEYCSVRIVS